MPQKSEVKEELEKMFGTEDEQQLSLLDKFKYKLVKQQYKKETLIYRMFFDKIYRPKRFNAIVNE